MAEEEKEVPDVPQPTLLDQIGALITRLDPLLAYIAEMEKRRENKKIIERCFLINESLKQD